MNEWINDKAVCRTAPATPSLSNTLVNSVLSFGIVFFITCYTWSGYDDERKVGLLCWPSPVWCSTALLESGMGELVRIPEKATLYCCMLLTLHSWWESWRSKLYIIVYSWHLKVGESFGGGNLLVYTLGTWHVVRSHGWGKSTLFVPDIEESQQWHLRRSLERGN